MHPCCIAFIGIQMQFQAGIGRDSDHDIAKDNTAAGSSDCHVHDIVILNSELVCVTRTHVNMTQCAHDSLR